MRHAIEEEEKIPLEQVTNFNEVCWLSIYCFGLFLLCRLSSFCYYIERLFQHSRLKVIKYLWYFLRFAMRSSRS